jgi:hypothetical protein
MQAPPAARSRAHASAAHDGAIVGGFLFGSILGFHYARGLNIASILVATAGAVMTLTLLGWSGTRPSLDQRDVRHLPGDRPRSGWR